MTPLQKLFQSYINECLYIRRLKPNTIQAYTDVFNLFIKTMSINNPSEMSQEVLTEFFYRLQVRKKMYPEKGERVGVKESTVRTYFNKLGLFFEWLRIKGHIIENPLLQMKAPQANFDDRRALEKEDILKIIAAITLHSHSTFLRKRDILIVTLLLFCGLRKTELLSLLLSDVDMDNREITVRGQISKSKKPRKIPINSTLFLHLQEYYSERKSKKYTSPYLIVAGFKDAPLTAHGLKHWVNKLSHHSGVAFHIHRFRHSFAYNLAKTNTSAVKIQKLLGHSDLKMTERYVRSMTVDDFRSDLEKISIETLC